jgi:hypothetical protein
MSKARELREDQERALAARGDIVRALRERQDPREITGTVAERFDVDEMKAYRWVMYTEQEYERNRRRIATAGLILLWTGVLIAAAGVVLGVFGVTAVVPRPIRLGLIAGLPLAVAGGTIAGLARRIAR